jgi:hypothetical protein
MRRKFYFLVSVILILFLFHCSSMRIAIDYDKDVSFEKYKTFSLIKPKYKPQRTGISQNPLFTKEVLHEIQTVLESKGFEKAESRESSDFLVHFYAMIQHRRDIVPPAYHVGRWGRVWRTRPGHVVHYKEGTLIIDIVDRTEKDLIWQGVGKGILDPHNPAANLIEAVKEVLKSFPPQSG